MAGSATFHCSVITPERPVLECDATFAAFPAHDGEVGVLPSRAPLVCKMGIGPLRVVTPTETHILFVDRGFAQVVENRLTLLTEQARKLEEIDPQNAEQSLAEARAMKIRDDASFTDRSNAIRRAQVQIKLSRRQ